MEGGKIVVVIVVIGTGSLRCHDLCEALRGCLGSHVLRPLDAGEGAGGGSGPVVARRHARGRRGGAFAAPLAGVDRTPCSAPVHLLKLKWEKKNPRDEIVGLSYLEKERKKRKERREEGEEKIDHPIPDRTVEICWEEETGKRRERCFRYRGRSEREE